MGISVFVLPFVVYLNLNRDDQIHFHSKKNVWRLQTDSGHGFCGKKRSKGAETPNHSFIWSQICMHFIPLSSIEKILSIVFQQLLLFPRYERSERTIFFADFNGVFYSKFLMKFHPAFFKQIVGSYDFYWTIIIFSNIGSGRSPCSCERNNLLWASGFRLL